MEEGTGLGACLGLPPPNGKSDRFPSLVRKAPCLLQGNSGGNDGGGGLSVRGILPRGAPAAGLRPPCCPQTGFFLRGVRPGIRPTPGGVRGY